ncbi:glycosyltransferase domain-containing protein [Maridesulfovibrio ferrireducens]|uniref:Glycosyltransferase domain-containing protein n=1 Tax=Maridesulfovibrio ferrireducens TaxID=246191 RepID=A0A1G9ET98_9BACT|nr:TIGR00180 family glycosyltransferase [Maridesulfovibrio ferrireducens]SDK79386.1 glycosyltransferase domain-containing protein [Maridesulfovibrio ferrireducens]
MPGKDVTLIVPTLERTNFLYRYVNALQALGFEGVLLIMDSSSYATYESTRKMLARQKLFYEVKHLPVPKSPGMSVSISINQAIALGVGEVETTYCMTAFDDDIPVPQTLDKCVTFLKENSDFTAVHGDIVFMHAHGETQNQKVALLPTLPYHQDQAVGRFEAYLNLFGNTMYLLTYPEIYKDNVPKEAYTVQFPHFAAEYVWMLNAVIKGKIGFINELFVIRQKHDDNLGSQNPYLHMRKAIFSRTWHNDINTFVDILANSIASVDNIPLHLARNACEQLVAYLVAFRLTDSIGHSVRQHPHFLKREKAYNTQSSFEQINYERVRDYVLAQPLDEPEIGEGYVAESHNCDTVSKLG